MNALPRLLQPTEPADDGGPNGFEVRLPAPTPDTVDDDVRALTAWIRDERRRRHQRHQER